MSLVEVKKDNHIAEVCLNRPDIHNAFNDEVINELKNIFNELESDEQTRVVVLTGKGKSFSAGADLNWMKSMIDYSEEENRKDSQNLASLFETLNNFPKPVIGKINGHALGGGVGLVSVCDFAIAQDKALFGFTEVRLGIIPAVISPFVMAKIGESHARAWFLSGERFSALQALKMNLVHEVVSAEDLEERVSSIAQSFLKAGPKAAVSAKKLIKNISELRTYEQIKDYTCSQIAKLRVSKEGQDGMKSILEKRKPQWQK